MSLLSDLNEKIKRLAQRLSTECNTLQTGVDNAKSIAEEALAGAWVMRGTEPITTPEEDTREAWGALPTGMYWYGTAGMLTSQPSQYGWLSNWHNPYGGEVYQLFISMPHGIAYRRGGNNDGWNSEFVPVAFSIAGRLVFPNTGAQLWIA